MDKILQLIVLALAIVCGVALTYALIVIANKALYQILAYPLRTLMILIGVGAIYGLYTMIDRHTRKI